MALSATQKPLDGVSNALSAGSAIQATEETFQAYEAELERLHSYLEVVIRVRVLATLIWDYADGRQVIKFFLDRQLSPSPSFALIPAQNLLSSTYFLKRMPGIEIITSRLPTSSHHCTIVKLNGQEIVKQNWGIKQDYEPEDLQPAIFFIEEEISWKALQVLRKNEEYFKCLVLQNLNEVYYGIDLSQHLSKSGVLEGQIKRIENSVSLAAYQALSCQKKAFDLQFIVQKKTEHVICYLKLNGLPLYEPSNPGRGMTEEEAIDDLLEKSGQYLLGMAKSLTLREFCIIENELLKRYPEQPGILANIIAIAAKQHWVSLF